MDISPFHQNVDAVFSNTTYYIDFYQRQYKWTAATVTRLLEDVFYRFEEEYKKYKSEETHLSTLITNYSWYYLSTYVTNKIDNKLYVVDGQQRLTTLTLILIKLNRQAKTYDSGLKDWINSKILGQSGYDKTFWMNHEAHKETLKALHEGANSNDVPTSSGITAQNMARNYIVIDKWLNEKLVDKHKFDSFVFYFLHRLVLINLNVEQTDVPMVFEVINDRGVKLKPYEILKGKLLGQIKKTELDTLQLNELWDEQVNKINLFKEDEIDQFFVYYLKAKLINTRGEGVKFDTDYHRVMFSQDVDKILRLKYNPVQVKRFLQNDFRYYTNLYAQLLAHRKREGKEQPWVYYNGLTEMDSQLMLILSACSPNDLKEKEKIKAVSYHVDRMFCLLQLQRSYDSNRFVTAVYHISSQIREKDVDEIRLVFDNELKAMLKEAKNTSAEEILTYGSFKDTGIELDKRFKRYLFARIEEFIASNTNLNIKHSLYDLVQNTGNANGFHVEHILAENAENKALFGDDLELFERERNRLGGLLLLKGRDNQSSNNETYSNKLQTYANTLYWNETLRGDTYKSKKDFGGMIDKYQLDFQPMPTFGPEELEKRHRLLFDMVKIIWQ
ncbi:MAG: hypothetical protein JWP57_4555 [Spirosoma sp.]|nr:hypothetical protein [Spirosoma sp.]